MCTPFTANVTVTGIHITECDILTVPDTLNVTTVDESQEENVDELLRSYSSDTAICENSSDRSNDLSDLKNDSGPELSVSERKLLYPE